VRVLLFLLIAWAAFPCEVENLFNGTDTSGWKMSGSGRFVVEDGSLKPEGGPGLLCFAQRQFANGVIRVEFRPTDGNSRAAVAVRMTERGTGGYRIQIGAGDPWHCTGAIEGHSRAASCPSLQSGEWHKMTIALLANETGVYVDGQKVNEYIGDPQAPYPGGWGRSSVGLENDGPGSEVYFRSFTFVNNFH